MRRSNRARRAGRGSPAEHRVAAAAALGLENLERRLLFCTLDHAADIPHFETRTAEVEPNDTLATATPLVGTSDSLAGTLSSSADADVYSTSLAHGQLITVNVGSDPGQRHYKPLVELIDPKGEVVRSSGDGSRMEYAAASAGTHYLRVSSASRYGTITGTYGTVGGSNLIGVTLGGVSGTLESEPNDAPAQANPVAATGALRGQISSAGDADTFSFSASTGTVVLLKSSQPASASPGMRVLNGAGTVVAENLVGSGLAYLVPAAGAYRVQLVSEKPAGGEFTGDYFVSLATASSVAAVSTEPPAGGSPFAAAPAWTVSSAVTRAAGALSGRGDLDLFAVNLVAGRTYTFGIDVAAGADMRGGRQLMLFNEFGQFMETSYTGSLATGAATGFGFRIEKTGRHFVGVRAGDDAGVGGYALTSQQTAVFPVRRDVPLVFHDYTGQRTHLGYGPAAPLTMPGAVPALIGTYESRYDIYDIDVTTALPTGTFLTFGMGEFGSIGAYGYGGSFNQNASSATVGQRRVSGQSVVDDPGGGFTTFAGIRNAASVMNQEIGHASGTYAHARNPLAAMAYDSQSSLISIGQYTPFPWTDSRVPDVEFRNERDYYDLVLQSGRIAEESEPNNATAQALTSFMSEMTGDALPRNDRVTVLGRIDSFTDADLYSLSLAAGATFAIDIDAAEFQNPLDASLAILDADGNLLASNEDGVDPDTGFDGVDPYLRFTAPAAGTYTVRVLGNRQTFGNYRLRLTSAAAFDADGPRVIASLPDGGASFDSTRQLVFFFNDQLDPATLKPGTIVVQGATTGVRSGTFRFDSTDTSLVWYADAPLTADTYTVTLVSGPGGITDLRGNPLDGETAGTLNWPNVSGDGSPGGDFVTTFSVTTNADTSAATVNSSSVRRHPYNRVLFTMNMSDELGVSDVYATTWQLRAAGADNTFGTPDDRLLPLDPHFDKVRGLTGSRILEMYTRGAIEFGVYRVEGATRDAAGNNVVINRSFSYTPSVGNGNLVNGPSVSDLSFKPGEALAAGPDAVSVTFSMPLNLAALSPENVRLRYSPNASFFDGDDVLVADADGAIAWDPTALRATIAPGAALEPGYYMIEVADAVTAAANGLALDGEFLNATLLGNTNAYTAWQFAPSGDGFAGGDFRATFTVADLAAPTVTAAAFGFLTGPQNLSVSFNENVGPSLSLADLDLVNVTTGQSVPSAAMTLVYDAATRAATITFPGLSGAFLPDGNYRLTLASAGVTDRVGFALDGDGDGTPGGDYQFEFFFLNGDANRDRAVNIADFGRLASSFNASGTFGEGDFDYDGTVTVADFSILAAKFNTTLPAPDGLAASIAGAEAAAATTRPRLAASSATAGSRFADHRIEDSLVNALFA